MIDTWILMKRNKEQPLQSLKEFSQLLQSLKKSIQQQQKDVEEIVGNGDASSLIEAMLNIKLQQIERLKNALKSALNIANILRI